MTHGRCAAVFTAVPGVTRTENKDRPERTGLCIRGGITAEKDMNEMQQEWRKGILVGFASVEGGRAPATTLEDQRPYVRQCSPDAEPKRWWQFNHVQWYITWNGRTCKLTEEECLLLQLLALRRGRPVEYVDIEDECILTSGAMFVSGAVIRQRKRRLAETLTEADLGDLAKAIVSRKETMSLRLSGNPRLIFTVEGR
jgi:hypothetical protein